MSPVLVFEQLLNGLQFGMILFLIAVGATLTFGVMKLVNLSHGAMLMVGAYTASAAAGRMPSFTLAVLTALLATLMVGLVLELGVMRRLYAKSHLDQVLATFGINIALSELAIVLWGREPLFTQLPAALEGSVHLFGLEYPLYRLVISAVSALAGIALFIVVARTRFGMLVRAWADRPQTLSALGANVRLLAAGVFLISVLLAALAGVMLSPLLAVHSGMGDPLMILVLAVVVIGGVGSLKGALVASLLVGVVDTFGRMAWPALLGAQFGVMLSNASVYVLMALVIAWRPGGLFPRYDH